MLGHSSLCWHRVVARHSLLLLLCHVVLVGHRLSLLFRDVASRGHAATIRLHVCVLRWERRVEGFFGRVDDRFSINPVAFASRLLCIETGLSLVGEQGKTFCGRGVRGEEDAPG